MKKIFFILILLCVSLTAYVVVAKTPKEQSLQHDILNNIQLSKVKANTLISPEDQIYQITSNDSSALLSLVESMSVKKAKIKDPKNYTSISFSGAGGSFQLFIYENNYITIPTQDTDTVYEIIEPKLAKRLFDVTNKIQENKQNLLSK